ncbi:hypothetical protein NM208_g12617 [Fusarium decemcellulare]|uniref:Uncharacterized protein n=1 Tax=Fusarium decemcellulare TaxID=57161 RepID=A0ACC1RSA9_9HYPO|nr:hypothetical protein NM208_g12617 [Fusarium decemcellulare]
MSGEEGRSDTNASASEILKETHHPTRTVLKETNHLNGVVLTKHDLSMGAVLRGADHLTSTVLPKTNRPTDTVLTEQDAPLEAGANPPDDGDSAFGSEPASSATSITSSLLEYRTVHGRRYHSDRVTLLTGWEI